jgi:Undecaprenyl-phosphate glucose phosphotransferase
MSDRVLRRRSPQYSSGLRATDPSSIFAVKSLLYPVAAVGCLLVCLLLWGEPLYGPYFLVSVLAFIAAADFLDVAQIHPGLGTYSSLRSLLDILLRWLLVVGFIWALLHLSGISERFHFRVLASWAVATPIVLWLGQITTQLTLSRTLPGRERPRKAVIIGLTELGLRLEEQLQSDPWLRTQVVGFFEDRSADRLPVNTLHKVLGKPSALPRFIVQNDINVVYVTLPMTRNPRVVKLLDALRDSTVSIYFVPDLFAFDLIQAHFDAIGGIPIVAVCESPFYGASSIAKRLSDIVIASVVLVLLAPLLLILALCVRLTSAGPIVFKQKRYGLDGREILVYKFRSMTVTEDGATQYTQVTPHDSRVTPFGAFMRKTSLDELPQLFNVLEGSLSIVGPRPHAIAVNEQYRKLIPGYMIRHKIKPGITGWAQINGYRGGDDLESMRKRIEFDLDYLRHWSLALDLSIILRTAAIVWHDKRAY